MSESPSALDAAKPAPVPTPSPCPQCGGTGLIVGFLTDVTCPVCQGAKVIR